MSRASALPRDPARQLARGPARCQGVVQHHRGSHLAEQGGVQRPRRVPVQRHSRGVRGLPARVILERMFPTPNGLPPAQLVILGDRETVMLSVKQAAERLDVSPALVYALCAKKRIRHERHGLGRGTIRIPEDALEEYRKVCAVEAGEGGSAGLHLKHIKL